MQWIEQKLEGRVVQKIMKTVNNLKSVHWTFIKQLPVQKNQDQKGIIFLLTVDILFVEWNFCVYHTKIIFMDVCRFLWQTFGGIKRRDKIEREGFRLEVDVGRLLFLTLTVWCRITYLTSITLSPKATCLNARLFRN